MKYFPGKVARCLLLTMMIWLAGILSVQAIPPVELGLGLTDAAAMDSSIVLDIKYATADNFTGQILYPSARCLLREPVAARLLRVQSSLRLKGLGLKVFDCYRPIEVQRSSTSPGAPLRAAQSLANSAIAAPSPMTPRAHSSSSAMACLHGNFRLGQEQR